MATPVFVWGREAGLAAGQTNLYLGTAQNPYGRTPAIGDTAIVVVTSFSTNVFPAITPNAGWTILHNTELPLYGGMYKGRTLVLIGELTETVTLSDIGTANGELINTVTGWGFSGAAQGSIASSIFSVDANVTAITFPAVSTTPGALVIRIANRMSATEGQWPKTTPAGYTRARSTAAGVEENVYDTAAAFRTATGSVEAISESIPLGQQGSMPGLAYSISLSDVAGPPTLADLELSSYEVPSNAPVGYVAANVLNQTSGSALVAQPGMSPKLELVGTEVRIKAALTFGDGLPVNLNEVLAGATGSPKEYGTVIDVVGPLYSQYVASASGTTTLVLPAHQPGDLLVAFLFRDGSTTAPVTPAGWTSAATGTGTTCSYRLVWKKATTSAESPGAATTATSTIVSCYRPGPGYVLSMGATAQGNGASTSLTYQSLSMQATDGTSRVAAFAGHRSVNTALENPPAGMVLRHSVVDATDEASAFDTNGGVSSWSAKTVGVGGTSSGWITTTFEIKAALDVPPPVGTVTFRAFMIH